MSQQQLFVTGNVQLPQHGILLTGMHDMILTCHGLPSRATYDRVYGNPPSVCPTLGCFQCNKIFSIKRNVCLIDSKQHSAATANCGANCMYVTTATSELGAIHLLVQVFMP